MAEPALSEEALSEEALSEGALSEEALSERSRVLRVLVAAYVAVWTTVRAPHLLNTATFEADRLDPVGVLAFLGEPVPDAAMFGVVLITPVAAVLFALDRRAAVWGPVAAIGFLLVTTYRNSWGTVFHTENLAALHLGVLALAALVRGRGRVRGRDPSWVVDAMAVLTVGTYFVAGVAKLRISGTAWLDGDVLRHQIAFDNARKEVLGDVSSPFAPWLLRQGWLLGPAAVMTMVVELGAPFALLHRWLRSTWVVLAVGFHIAIVVFMAIVFPYHLVGIALAPLLPVERLGATVRRWTGGFRGASTRSLRVGSLSR